jgi:hypothetical protein
MMKKGSILCPVCRKASIFLAWDPVDSERKTAGAMGYHKCPMCGALMRDDEYFRRVSPTLHREENRDLFDEGEGDKEDE